MTEGRRMLLALLQRTTAALVAARCGVTHQAVSSWARGASRPGARAAKALENASGYAIPAASWRRKL